MCYISGVIVAAPDADACSMPQARRFSRYAVTDDGRPVDEAKTDDDAKALAKEASRTGSEHHEPSRTTRGTVLFYTLVLHQLGRRRLASAKIFP